MESDLPPLKKFGLNELSVEMLLVVILPTSIALTIGLMVSRKKAPGWQLFLD